MSFILPRLPHESYQEVVQRVASKHGLADQCLKYYKDQLRLNLGMSKFEAAFRTLHAWGLLEWEED